MYEPLKLIVFLCEMQFIHLQFTGSIEIAFKKRWWGEKAKIGNFQLILNCLSSQLTMRDKLVSLQNLYTDQLPINFLLFSNLYHNDG